MIVYGSGLSPYVRKVLVTALEKGVEVTHEARLPHDPSPEFRAASPLGKIPGFADGDFNVGDSTAIVTYLEAKFPERSVLPSDPKLRAKAVFYQQYADTIMFPVITRIFFNRVAARLVGVQPDLEAADWSHREFFPGLLAFLEAEIGDKRYVVGDRLTLGDICICSHLLNADYAGAPIDGDKYPKTMAYFKGITARPSFAAREASDRAILASMAG